MAVAVTRPGFYKMPLVDYVGDPAPRPSLSASIAHHLISRSARHAWHAHPRLNPLWAPDGTDATEFGTIAHAILLEIFTDSGIGTMVLPERSQDG
jgi:hypothetical protein